MRHLFFLLTILLAVGCNKPLPVPSLSTSIKSSEDVKIETKAVDRLGRTIRFTEVPQRIVSLSPSTTELMYAIGAGRFYATDPKVIRDTYASKEQNFLTKAADEVTFWPPAWCVPFSHACLPRNRLLRFFSRPKPPRNGKILVFFGSITPASALRGEHEIKKRVSESFRLNLTQRRFKPANWIGDYWRE